MGHGSVFSLSVMNRFVSWFLPFALHQRFTAPALSAKLTPPALALLCALCELCERYAFDLALRPAPFACELSAVSRGKAPAPHLKPGQKPNALRRTEGPLSLCLTPGGLPPRPFSEADATWF